MIRELSYAEICEVYETYLVNDFIPQERKPLSRIGKLAEAGSYPCFGLFVEDELKAYAFMAKADGTRRVLLDYLAVVSKERGNGYGSRMLQELKNLFGNNGILIEVENGSDVTGEELEECQRRLRFYGRQGVKRSKLTVMLWGKPLDVYYLANENTEREMTVSVKEDLSLLYNVMYTKEELETQIEIYSK